MKKETSVRLIENCMFEVAVTALRCACLREKALPRVDEGNVALPIAKQYIKDNTESAPQVSDVAKHCYISRRQLTRIFDELEGLPPGEYIRKKRAEHIEKLLPNSSLTLKQISDIMNFRSEYYFSAFFKKYTVTPPGKYRQFMLKK